jgi:exosortase
MAVLFLVAYLPTYVKLANGPWQTEQGGHGPIIMLAAIWLAWQQRERLAFTPLSLAPLAGWITLVGSLLLMAVTRSQDILMVEVFTQIPVLFACLLLIGGWGLVRVFAFPLAFLVFSLPPPGWIIDVLTVPLKAWISDVVTNFLYGLGYPIAQNGVMIMIGSYELMVKDACSGMNSIFALSTIGIFYVHEFVDKNSWFRKLSLIISDRFDRSNNGLGQFLPGSDAGSRVILSWRGPSRGSSLKGVGKSEFGGGSAIAEGGSRLV